MNPIVKYELIIEDEIFDITDSVSSWDEISIVSQRNGLSGVITDVSAPIEIAQNKRNFGDVSAFDIIKNLYDSKGIHAKAALNIYLRDDVQNDVYTLEKSINLDFQKYEERKDLITITGTSPELQEYINSHGRTNFDIPVSEIAEAKKFKYAPLLIQSSADFEMPLDSPFQSEGLGLDRNVIVPIYISFSKVDTITGRSILECRDQISEVYQAAGFAGQEYFLKNTSETDWVNVSMNLSFEVLAKIPMSQVMQWDYKHVYLSMSIYHEANLKYTDVFNMQLEEGYETEFHGALNQTLNLSLPPLTQVSLYLRYSARFILYPPFTEKFNVSALITEFDKLEVRWAQTSGETSYFDVIQPQKLAQTLLNKMSLDAFTVQIRWGGLPYIPLLCAGESIRNYSNAYIHTSLGDFIDWLKTKGIGYSIDGNILIFDLIENFFRKDITSVSLDKREVSNLIIASDAEHAYTSVEIGCTKKEYNNLSGKFELNGVYEYTTDYTNAKENKLSLLTPYRNDPYGIEFLTWERWNDTKDDKADNDVFELASQDNGGYYGYYNQVYSIVPAGKVYNAILNPYFLALRNEAIFGIITKKLTFSSTTNNRELEIKTLINGTEVSVPSFSDIRITKKLFDPIRYTVEVGTHKRIAGNTNGIVEFPIQGDLEQQTFKGFIFEVPKNYSKEQKEEWILLAVRD